MNTAVAEPTAIEIDDNRAQLMRLRGEPAADAAEQRLRDLQAEPQSESRDAEIEFMQHVLEEQKH